MTGAPSRITKHEQGNLEKEKELYNYLEEQTKKNVLMQAESLSGDGSTPEEIHLNHVYNVMEVVKVYEIE